MFFMDSSHRLNQTLLNADVPSVNIRGMMDQVQAVLHVFQYWLLLTCCCLILAVSIPNIGPNTDGNSSRNVSQNWTQTSTGISKWVSLPVSLPSFSSYIPPFSASFSTSPC